MLRGDAAEGSDGEAEIGSAKEGHAGHFRQRGRGKPGPRAGTDAENHIREWSC